MTKNPVLNALAALVYITAVASAMFYGGRIEDSKFSFFTPIFVLSLFTFSAAVMGYVFFYHPFQMYFDGKKKDAVALAFRSFAYFGGIILLLFILLLLGVAR